jgi:gliding motility-associated-like protein
LPAGTYTVTVTDANGCTEVLTAQIGQPAGALTATLQTSQNVSCYGGSNGSIQIQVTQGTAPYTYSWSNGATTQNISGLPAGTYTVTVTDANGCTEIFSHTLTQPAGPLSVYLAAQQNVNCFGGSDAFIDVEVMSGTPPYTYLWNTGATTQDLNNLPAGTYTVTVTDANGCTEVLTTTIIEPAGALQVSLSVLQNVGCYGAASGSISIAVSMGSPPYTFQWSNGATTQNLVNVPAGTYTVTVTDYHGCTETLSATITQPQGALQAVIQSIGNADCRGNTTGSVTIQVMQGTPPYTFLWSNGATTQNISGVAAGTYTVTITDANGCTETLTASVTQPAGVLSVTLQSLQHVGCHGEATGSITITVTQGTPPYTFNWNNGATTQNIQGLPAGTYIVTVTDMNGCTETLSATITEPLQSLTINGQTTSANCLVGINGAVYVNVSGGTSPYSYSWSNGATTQNLSSVPQGTYTVLVTDVNGCTAQSQFSVTDNSSFNAQADGPTTVCVGDLVYLFADSIPGATYQWYLNGQILGGATYPHFVTPVAGIYTVTIQHACGTFTSQPIEVNVHSAANVSFSPNVIICPGESVQLWASGGVHYLWTPATGLDFPNVPNPVASPATTTVYTVEVINAEGCRATAQVMVTVFCDTLIIPSGYSPNNDGINDGFVIVGIEKFPDNKIWIYNRWGNLVYKANGYKNDWDGYSNVPGIYIGKKVPAGTYFYVLDLGANQKPRQGYIVLRY